MGKLARQRACTHAGRGELAYRLAQSWPGGPHLSAIFAGIAAGLGRATAAPRGSPALALVWCTGATGALFHGLSAYACLPLDDTGGAVGRRGHCSRLGVAAQMGWAYHC